MDRRLKGRGQDRTGQSPWEEIFAEFPEEDKRRVKEMSKILIAREEARRELLAAWDKSRARMAKKLGISRQAELPSVWRDSDALLRILREKDGDGQVDAAASVGDNWRMMWRVEAHKEFREEVADMPQSARNALASTLNILSRDGPHAKRPAVGTLNGSRFANMKELRFNADGGVWRVAFAFDPRRRAILLVAGDKAGVSQRRFYRRLIRIADERFQRHLNHLRQERSSR